MGLCAVGAPKDDSRQHAPWETSQTLVSILGDQCMRVQNQCSVTNILQSLVTRRVLPAVARSGCAVLEKVCADNVDSEIVLTVRSSTTTPTQAVGQPASRPPLDE